METVDFFNFDSKPVYDDEFKVEFVNLKKPVVSRPTPQVKKMDSEDDVADDAEYFAHCDDEGKNEEKDQLEKEEGMTDEQFKSLKALVEAGNPKSEAPVKKE